MACKVEDYSEFLICQLCDELRCAVSVCEQRNAAFVRTALGERKTEVSRRKLIYFEVSAAAAVMPWCLVDLLLKRRLHIFLVAFTTRTSGEARV